MAPLQSNLSAITATAAQQQATPYLPHPQPFGAIPAQPQADPAVERFHQPPSAPYRPEDDPPAGPTPTSERPPALPAQPAAAAPPWSPPAKDQTQQPASRFALFDASPAKPPPPPPAAAWEEPEEPQQRRPAHKVGSALRTPRPR
jgi:hypothetical protein